MTKLHEWGAFGQGSDTLARPLRSSVILRVAESGKNRNGNLCRYNINSRLRMRLSCYG